MRWVRWAAAAGLMLSSTACSTDSGPPSGQPTDEVSGAWYLVRGSFQDEAISPDPLRRVTLVTDPQNAGKPHDIAGFSGCNWYSVSFDYLGTLEAGTGTSTAMGCPGPDGRLESLFHSALADVDDAEQSDDSLVLTGGKSSLTFAPIPPIPLDDLVGQTWLLESIVRGDVTSPDSVVAARGPTATLQLDDDGKATVSTGCGQAEQDWTVFLGDVRVQGGAMYDMDACPPSLRQQHDSVLGVLFDSTPTLDGDRLLLQGHSGAGLVYTSAQRQQGARVPPPSDEGHPAAAPFDCAAVIPDKAYEVLAEPTSPSEAVEGICRSRTGRGTTLTVDPQGRGRKTYDAMCEQLRTGGGTYAEPANRYAPGQTACASMYDAESLVGEATLVLLTDEDHVVRVTIDVEQPTSTNRAQWALRRIGEEVAAVW